MDRNTILHRMVTRGYRREIGFVAVFLLAFFGGRLLVPVADVGERQPIAAGLEIGDDLPQAVVHSQADGPRPIKSLIAPEGRTAIGFVNGDCESCMLDARVWEAAAQRAGPNLRLIMLVCSNDFERVEEFRSNLPIVQSVYLCDTTLRQTLKMRELPGVLVLDSTGTLVALGAGVSFPSDLEGFITNASLAAAN